MPADDPLDELFPIRRDGPVSSRPGRLEIPQRYRRKRATRRLRSVAAAPVPAPDDDGWAVLDELPRTGVDHADHVDAPASRAIGIGIVCAVLALVLRAALTHIVAPQYLHELPARDMALGDAVVLVVTAVLGRIGVSIAVCLATACAIATLDVAAPVGVALVVAALAWSRRFDG